MVICTYYLNNNCRFGAKCNNDHIDLGAVIKSEVEVTQKGNQWPLSCFGPFKERNSIPNFIEDLSFEEIRIMFLEAKMQNNIAGHSQILAQLINDAKQKMQWITSTNRDVMNVLIEIYNQPDDAGKAAAAGTTTAGNPFAAASIGTGSSSVAANIFGGGSSGGFGGSAFGGGTAASTSNIFGAATNQTASSIFGGGATNTAGTLGGSIFAKAAQPVAANTNIFGQPQQQQPQTASVFGGGPTFGGTGTSLFASVTQPAAPIFGGAVVTPAASSNPFAQAQPQATTGFGAAPPSQNLFASVAPVQSAPTNPFGGGFSAQPQPSPFGQPAPTSSNLFLPVPTQQVAPAPVALSPFGGGAVAMPSPFGTNPGVPTAAATAPASNQFANLYSKMEDLSTEQLEAFKAERFELGKIPTVPPPKELCS